MPAQKTWPAASKRMHPTDVSSCAASNWSASAVHRSRLSALRFSGRLSVRRSTRPSRLTSKLIGIDLNLHAEDRGAVRFSLRINAERQRATAAERLVQEEIERAQIR